MAGEEKIKVLVVDDEKIIRDFLTRLLSFEGLEVKTVEDGVKAVELAQREKFDLIFLDIKMPNMNGIEVFSRLKRIDPGLSCVFMTGYALEAALLDKAKLPGSICLKKPFEDIAEIKEAAYKVLREVKEVSQAQGGYSERRAYARLNINLEVDYRVKQEQGLFTRSSSKDVAPGGIRLIVAQGIAAGTVLELVMRVQGNNEACKATGEVAWLKGSEDKTGCYEVGIKFIEIDYAELAMLFIRSGIIASS